MLTSGAFQPGVVIPGYDPKQTSAANLQAIHTFLDAAAQRYLTDSLDDMMWDL